MKIFGKNVDEKLMVLVVLGGIVSVVGMLISNKTSEHQTQLLKKEIKDDIIKDLKLIN